MKSRSFLLPLTLTACAVAALTSHAEIRKWTSKAGTSLEAEMTGVDVAARTISLKKTDGSVITIPIDALTDADRDFAAAEWKKMQSAPAGAPAAPASAPAAAPK
ncbi:MAG TPA: SHD1 domain-containing protein, partial [Prosthecobacter sp.]|nr:SHD1 domain-containing protein [Prosthecobacter sp.]